MSSSLTELPISFAPLTQAHIFQRGWSGLTQQRRLLEQWNPLKKQNGTENVVVYECCVVLTTTDYSINKTKPNNPYSLQPLTQVPPPFYSDALIAIPHLKPSNRNQSSSSTSTSSSSSSYSLTNLSNASFVPSWGLNAWRHLALITPSTGSPSRVSSVYEFCFFETTQQGGDYIGINSSMAASEWTHFMAWTWTRLPGSNVTSLVYILVLWNWIFVSVLLHDQWLWSTHLVAVVRWVLNKRQSRLCWAASHPLGCRWVLSSQVGWGKVYSGNIWELAICDLISSWQPHLGVPASCWECSWLPYLHSHLCQGQGNTALSALSKMPLEHSKSLFSHGKYAATMCSIVPMLLQ